MSRSISETVDGVTKESYKRIQPNFELITIDQNKIIKINAPVKAVSDDVYVEYIRKLEADLAAENRASLQHTIAREAAKKIYIQDRVGLLSYNSLRLGFTYPPYVPKLFAPPPKLPEYKDEIVITENGISSTRVRNRVDQMVAIKDIEDKECPELLQYKAQIEKDNK